MDAELDDRGVPVIHSLSAKIGSLERRRDRLARNIEQRRGSPGALGYDQAEHDALEAALVALRFHRALVEQVGHPLEALKELVVAYDGPVDKEGRMKLAVAKAWQVLEVFEG